MDGCVGYELRDSIATITLDDGKRNALSLAAFTELGAAFERARREPAAAVVLTGRPDVFSAGFDLSVMRAGGAAMAELVRTGFELAERILAFPAPVVVACTGHAIAMGVFLVLAGDYRIGARGAYKIGANEVAIGIPLPHFAIELCRQKLAPTHFHRAVSLSELYTPEDAVVAGFLDRVAPADELANAAREAAARFASYDRDVHATSKLRVRAPALRALRAAIEADF
jgi:enoyl-CoA hydratase